MGRFLRCIEYSAQQQAQLPQQARERSAAAAASAQVAAEQKGEDQPCSKSGEFSLPFKLYSCSDQNSCALIDCLLG